MFFSNLLAIVTQTVLAVVAMACLSASFIGYVSRPLAWTGRVALAGAGVAFIVQGPLVLAAGGGAALAVAWSQRRATRSANS